MQWHDLSRLWEEAWARAKPNTCHGGEFFYCLKILSSTATLVSILE